MSVENPRPPVSGWCYLHDHDRCTSPFCHCDCGCAERNEA